MMFFMIYKSLKSFVVLALSAVLLTSCATLFTKSSQEIMFKGVPGSVIKDKKKNQTIAHIGDNGFATAKIRKQLSSKQLEVTNEGYVPGNYQLDTKIQGWFWGNIIFGGIPGMGIDALTGKMKKYSTNLLDVTLQPLERQENQEEVVIPFIVQQTEQEPTNEKYSDAIVRWYIDSDPRGARIYWRVISNIPDQVHNTNESYLTTTPLEETRSFNIPGLTYENASGVTIEIKLTKRGYEDQVKRYNVRQAIDQQEISGFFELVPKTAN